MGKTTQLVCQHLENISREALEKHESIVRQYVRRRQGVYALYRRRKLYYVGLAGDLRWRLRAHLRDHHGPRWDRFSVYLTIGEKHLRELESLLLRVVKPTGNKQRGKFSNSENLVKRFKRDVRALQRSELAEMVGRGLEHASLLPEERRSARRPILAPFVSAPMKLRATLKGRTFHARVRKDGSIRFNGKTFRSPSQAGYAATKRSCNGWRFWRYERAPGDWVRLRELRK